MRKASQKSSIPPLKSGCDWVRTSKAKADLFVDTFSAKSMLSPEVGGFLPESIPWLGEAFCDFIAIRSRKIKRLLDKLDVNSATGPDHIPGCILKMCSKTLCLPLALLCRLIFWQSCWPSCWKFHWVVPLYKRLSPSLPKNYRGIHLTCILAKIAERVLGQPMFDFVEKTGGFGLNQFAYRRGFSMKDLLALLVLVWLRALDKSFKIGVYCSDIEVLLTGFQLTNFV